MLLRRETLEAIRDGRIDVAFRRWRKPTVRAGGTLLTALGELEVREVAEHPQAEITDADARSAGFASRDALVRELERRPTGVVYRVVFGALRPDPRAALRASTELDHAEKADVVARLSRMDARSSDGPWTEATLRAIRDAPGLRAGDLCRRLDQETSRFKKNVRKLKALGLTESLETGYRLSPRGSVVLELLASKIDGAT